MLGFLHLVTVGTSIIRNASFSDNVGAETRSKLVAWARALPGSSEDLEAGARVVSGANEFKTVLGLVSSNPRKVSAELNAFIGYLEYLASNGVRGVRHHVILLGSDTGAGWFSTRILEKYLKEIVDQDLYNIWGIEGHILEAVETRRIEKLGVHFSEGILNLIAEVKKITLTLAPRYNRILANLTGGFKPESAAILVAAGLIGIDTVYYVHEFMKNVVELPIIPLKVDENAKKLLLNALNDKIGLAERKLLSRLGLLVTGNKLSSWAKSLLRILIT